MKLTEGLRPNDLEDTVLPIVSVDEWESKISNKALVVAFFTTDKDAANDLNRFIQKSPYGVIDSEVSNTMDKDGYYLVFVEFYNDKKLSSNIKDILGEINNLANIKDWTLKLRNIPACDFSEEIIKKYVDKEIKASDKTNKSLDNQGTLFDKFD